MNKILAIIQIILVTWKNGIFWRYFSEKIMENI